LTPDAPTVTTTPRLTLAGADALIAAARRHADDMRVAVVVHVADPGGHPLAMVRMDGSPTFSLVVAAKKAWTAAAGGVDTSRLATDFSGNDTLLHGVAGNVDDLIAVGGGVPVIVDGTVAGAIGVSGATEEQDHAIARAAVDTVFG
jgi:glc operon protein GlcG